MAYNRISYDERTKIYYFYDVLNWSIYKIALALNRHYTSIEYEIKNKSNYKVVTDETISIYEPYYAQQLTNENKLKQKKHNKIIIRSDLYNQLIIALKNKVSPELFAGSWNLNHCDQKISYETIYIFIYKNQHLGLYKQLIRHHKYRGFRKPHTAKAKIPDYTSIDKRPKNISKRKAGTDHIEVDSVESPKKIQACIHTAIDRQSRLFQARKVPSLSSADVYKAEKSIIKTYNKFTKVKSITYDNGKENYLHYKLKPKYNINTYFCHPNAPYEKGAIERANALFRLWFPKGTDFSKVSQHKINKVVNLINNRPMKCLGFKSPYQFMRECQNAPPK
jgi:IS30 family transposase